MKYLFISSVNSHTICPPYFVLDDPTLGKTPDGLDPLRTTLKDQFTVDALDEEAIAFLGLASPFLTPKNNYTKIMVSFMMMYPESILYIVDGYPKPLIEAHCRMMIENMNQLRETPEDHKQRFDTWRYHEITKGQTDDVSTWVGMMDTCLPRKEPHVFFEHVEEYRVMKTRMDNARAWGEANGYRVVNFHEDLLETSMPFVHQYLTAVQEYTQMLQMQQRMRGQAPPKIQIASETPPLGH